MELVLGRVLESERVKAMLAELKMSVLEAERVKAELMPKYEALINEIEWVVEDGLDAENVERSYDNTYLLNEDSFNEYLRRKEEISVEMGYELPVGYCPILVAESKVNEIYLAILGEVVKAVPSMANVRMHMANYDNFKRILRGLAGL